jgi:CRP-like cAMP-binding protein
MTNLGNDMVNLYSVTALDTVAACFIQKAAFTSLIHKNGHFAMEIIRALTKNEINYFNRFVNHSQKQIDGRLAEALLFFCREVYGSESFTLPLSRKDLSALITASRESVIRELQSFATSGLISVKGKTITILDLQRLDQISHNG